MILANLEEILTYLRDRSPNIFHCTVEVHYLDKVNAVILRVKKNGRTWSKSFPALESDLTENLDSMMEEFNKSIMMHS